MPFAPSSGRVGYSCGDGSLPFMSIFGKLWSSKLEMTLERVRRGRWQAAGRETGLSFLAGHPLIDLVPRRQKHGMKNGVQVLITLFCYLDKGRNGNRYASHPSRSFWTVYIIYTTRPNSEASSSAELLLPKQPRPLISTTSPSPTNNHPGYHSTDKTNPRPTRALSSHGTTSNGVRT